jgi:hypothetical protein
VELSLLVPAEGRHWGMKGVPGTNPECPSCADSRRSRDCNGTAGLDPNRSFVAGADVGRPRSKAAVRSFHETLNASRSYASRAGRYTATGRSQACPPTGRAETRRVSAADIASRRSRTLVARVRSE